MEHLYKKDIIIKTAQVSLSLTRCPHFRLGVGLYVRVLLREEEFKGMLWNPSIRTSLRQLKCPYLIFGVGCTLESLLERCPYSL